MMSLRNRHEGPRGVNALTMIAAVGAIATLAICAFEIRPVSAYDQWSVDRSTGNCATCHGDFRTTGYVSRNDGVAWVGGASLHNGHRTNLLSGDCASCHESSRFPTRLNVSSGGVGFPTIGCLGCHGRAEPGAGGAVTGAGLRQHHQKTGAATCDGAGCHMDSNPAAFTTAPESVKPPYYFSPDASHPNKPTDPCNANGLESQVAPPVGLDNNGNNVYDAADCTTVSVEPGASVALALQGAWPNPARGSLRVTFSLPGAEPAKLEAFDVNGRRLAVIDVGSMGAGTHVVNLAPNRTLVAGIVLLKLTQGDRVLTTKATLIR